MFNNIGERIKKIAKIVTIINFVLSSALGVGWIVAVLVSTSLPFLAVFAPLVVAIGCLLSWIGGMFIYGFGELIERTKETERLTEETNKLVKSILNNF